jgi:hypothetical protein
MPAGSFPWVQPTTRIRAGAFGSPRSITGIGRPSTLWPGAMTAAATRSARSTGQA